MGVLVQVAQRAGVQLKSVSAPPIAVVHSPLPSPSNRAYIDNKLWWQVPVGTYSLKEDSEDSKTSKSERDRGDHFIFQWGLVKGISNAKSRLFTTLHILKEVH